MMPENPKTWKGGWIACAPEGISKLSGRPNSHMAFVAPIEPGYENLHRKPLKLAAKKKNALDWV